MIIYGQTKKHVKIPIQFKGSFIRNVGIIGLNVKYSAEALTTFPVDFNEFLNPRKISPRHFDFQYNI